jgi:membrane protein YdbS with pleckstrin-like domain
MSQIYCSNCGQLIPHNSNFCKYCGAAQHGQEASGFRANEPATTTEEKPAHNLKSSPDTIARSKLSPSVVILFFFNYLKVSFLLFVLLIVGVVMQPLIFSLVTLLAVVTLLIIALWAYSNFWYEVTDDGLFIKFGIINQKTISVPFDQVQNVNIERSLVDRLFGLARISIETAGSAVTQPMQVIGGYTAKSEAYIPGLTLPSAKTLHDILLDGKIDGVI